MVSGGYPGPYEKGKHILGIEDVTDSIVFHAGTQLDGAGELVTDGGRVLALTSYGDTFEDALQLSYENARKIKFEGGNYRGDIGFDL
jgi:phosphoribosylamine--glycine ligase